jgi:hypothetical protein
MEMALEVCIVLLNRFGDLFVWRETAAIHLLPVLV